MIQEALLVSSLCIDVDVWTPAFAIELQDDSMYCGLDSSGFTIGAICGDVQHFTFAVMILPFVGA